MKDFDALKNIWHGQPALPKLSYDDILNEVKKSRSSLANKLLFETLGMIAAILFLAFIWIAQTYLMWTSHLSLLILIGCCIYYIYVQFNHYQGIAQSQSHFEKPNDYIAFLKNYRRKRYTLNTKNYTIYSIFIGLAFFFYFIEVYFAAPIWQTLLGVGFTVIWFVVCAFLMRNYIKREQEKLNKIIGNLEKLEKQFEG